MTTSLHKELEVVYIETGCRMAIVLGIIGVMSAPTPELKIGSGMLIAGGFCVLSIPQSSELLNKFFPHKKH